MPKINVYLSDELAEAVREANLPVSAICQHALEQAVSRVTAIRQTVLDDGSSLRADLDDANDRFSRFTARARSIIAAAMDTAASSGTPTATEHLLAAMIAEGANLAMSVLTSMQIEPQEVTAVLAARRPSAVAGTPVEPAFDEPMQEVLRLAVTESTSFGHNYVGTEHLLLGFIGEPDGLAGQVLRGLGAELRLTRRAVAGAIAGFAALQARSTTNAGGGSATLIAAMLAEAVRTELAPIVKRLEQLERR